MTSRSSSYPRTSSDILAKAMAAKDRPRMAPAQEKALAAGNIIRFNATAKASTPEAEKKLEAFHTYMKSAITLD